MPIRWIGISADENYGLHDSKPSRTTCTETVRSLEIAGLAVRDCLQEEAPELIGGLAEALAG